MRLGRSDYGRPARRDDASAGLWLRQATRRLAIGGSIARLRKLAPRLVSGPIA
ncbi:MAG: hypothetical protein ACK5QX_12480 [bacterium]